MNCWLEVPPKQLVLNMQIDAIQHASRNARIEHVFDRVSQQLAQIGLSVSAWSVEGHLRGNLSPGCQFCNVISGHDGPCFDAHKKLAQRVMSELEEQTSTDGPCCCLMGVPVFRRRRLVGALVASYPTSQLLDDEHLARICSQSGLDLEHVTSLLEEMDQHQPAQLQVFSHVLKWQLESAQSMEIAGSEIGTLSANLAQTYEELNLLYRIAGSMQVTQLPQDFMLSICNELQEGLLIEAAIAVVYAHPPTFDKDLIVVSGQTDMDDSEIIQLVSEVIEPRINEDGPAVANGFTAPSECPEGWQSIKSYLASPLVTGDSLGVLIAINKSPDQFDSLDLKLTDSIASQASVFIENNRLFADLQDLLMGVLHALSATIDAKDPYTSGHSLRVALISKRLAQECDLGEEKAERLYLAGLLHDIGKIGVPEATLTKEGRLTDDEFEQMKRHPMLGATILGGIRQLDDVIVGILNHHERPDGLGYPRGLVGDEVSIDGLIVGIADCLDAMTSDRTYRKALPLSKAMSELKKYAGQQFDPELVEKLLQMDVEAFLHEIHRPDLAPLI